MGRIRVANSRTRSRLVPYFLSVFLHLASGTLDAPAQQLPTDLRPRIEAEIAQTGGITSVVFSPNGKMLASGSSDTTIKLWDLSTGEGIRTLSGHSRPVSSLAFSPDGMTLASGAGSDERTIVWDVAEGKPRTLTGTELGRGHGLTGIVSAVRFSTDGKTLAGASRAIRLWDVATWQAGTTVPDDPDNGWDVAAFSSDLKRLAASRYNGGLIVLDVATSQTIRTLRGHSGVVMSLAFSLDGKILASGGEDTTIRLWSVAGGQTVHTLSGHTGKVLSVAFSPDGKKLASGSNDSTIRLWDVASGQTLYTLTEHTGGVSSVAFSPDGKLLASGSDDSTIRLWDVASGQRVHTLTAHTHRVLSLAFSPNGKELAGGNNDKTATLWDLTAGQVTRTLTGHNDAVLCVAFSPDNEMLASGSGDKTIRLWDVTTGQTRSVLQGHTNAVSSVSFSPREHKLASGSEDTTIRIWNLATGETVSTFTGYHGGVLSVAFSPNGQLLASGGNDPEKGPRVWDIATGQIVHTYGILLPGGIASVAFSPDGRTVASGSLDGWVGLYPVGDGLFHTLARRGEPALSVAFSPDGNTVASANGKTLETWDRGGGHQALTPASNPTRIAFRSEDRILASNGPNRIQIWRGDPSGDWRQLVDLFSFDNGRWLVADPDGRFDTNDVDEIEGLHWVFPDDPFRPLPPEILMRDYYEPRLLPQLLSGKELKAIRPLAVLNRVQPLVEVTKVGWQDAAHGVAEVMVRVSRNSDPVMRNGKTSTDAYDLRVFRDGQLVGWTPRSSVDWQLTPQPTGPKADEEDLASWREKTHIDLDRNGTKELSFIVQVPRRANPKQVTFTAYAFNEDRVKSATASATLTVDVDQPFRPRMGKAYVISVGVNRTESSPAWDLQYAANDARQMSSVLTDKLEGTKQFAKVVPIRLVSDKAGKEQPQEAAATKAHVQAVLDVLAGRRTVDEQLKKEIPRIDEVEKAQPEDLVLLAFSSHGYTDDRGVFHLVLADIGRKTPQDKITAELQEKSLSSDELSGWLREVDAGEMVMVVDSCHSAATVEAEGFKPGPMGSRGLGQMAYDKGMRILAASKSEQSAVEREGVEHGLLSYALVEEGLVKGLADFQPKDGKVLMGEWLAYGEQEVPKLFQEGDAKGVIQVKGGPDTAKEIYHGGKQTPSSYQQPVLFDFTKDRAQSVLAKL